MVGADQLSRDKLPPRPPTDVTAVNPLADSVRVRWTDNNNAETGYEVQRSTGPDFGRDLVSVGVAAPDQRQMVDLTGTIESGKTYYYRVRALGAPAPSAYAEAPERVVPGDPPAFGFSPFDDFANVARQSQWALNGSTAFRDAGGDPLGASERLMLT